MDLPPHLSPFVKEEEGDYIPPERQAMLEETREEETQGWCTISSGISKLTLLTVFILCLVTFILPNCETVRKGSRV